MTAKPKVAFYWCASCGGCEEAILDLNEAILDVVAAVDIVFWPVALDFKYKDVEAMEDGEITVSFINGAIRSDEQKEVAELLRRKSKIVIAFGACAHLGGIPGLANFADKAEVFDRAYISCPSVDNPDLTLPLEKTERDGSEVELPAFFDTVRTLDQTVDVDYYLPGCPPMPETISDALGAILEGRLPGKGTVLSPGKALCDECERNATKPDRFEISSVRRPHEVMIDPEKCFLEQGIICAGPSTRSGCGTRCINANMPCRGCYGPTDRVADGGLAALSGLASILSAVTEEDARAAAEGIKDPAGTFFRFSLPASLLSRRRMEA